MRWGGGQGETLEDSGQGKGVWEPGQAQEWVHPHQPKATSAEPGPSCLRHQEEPEELGERPGRRPNQLRHGALMTQSTGHCLGPGTPEPPGPEKTNFRYALRLLQQQPGQEDKRHFPHSAAGGTETWQTLTETGAHFPVFWGSGSLPPSSQDPDVPHHCARNPDSLDGALSTCAPLPDPPPRPNLASSPCTALRKRANSQDTHRTGWSHHPGLRSGANLGQGHAELWGRGTNEAKSSPGPCDHCPCPCSVPQEYLRSWEFRLHKG